MKQISLILSVRSASWFVIVGCLSSAFGAEPPTSGSGYQPPAESAQAGIAQDINAPWMLGSINSGIKTNDAYTDGSFSIVAPVWSSIGSGSTLEGGLVYVEPYISWGEGGEVASSLGMGWRYLFSDQPVSALSGRDHDCRQAGFFEEGWAIGASLFLDMLDTQSNRQFWQLGTGVEVMSRYLELRGNYYLPLTGKKESGSFRTHETSTTTQSRTSYTTQTATTDPYATGYTIAQDINQSVTATTETRTTTTTIERLVHQYQEGLEGWDAELAVLVPWIDRWMDVKLVGGYYHFDNQPFGPQARGTGKVEGWKAGVEVRPVPALALSASWYQDDKLTGSDWIAGFRIELPFETTNIDDGKGGFWGHIKDAFKPRRRHFAERLAEPVHRQNAAVKLGGVTEQKKATATTTTSSLQRITRVVSQTSTRIVLADDVVFVDNSIGSPTNPGTYEAPLDTIQGGENTANGLFGDNGKVFVQGGGPSYVEQVLVDRSTAFYGSGRGMPLAGGNIFNGRNTTTPVLVGHLTAMMTDSLVVSGFDLRASTSQPGAPFMSGGITTFGVGNVTIVGNSISRVNSTYGVALECAWRPLVAVVEGNVISGFSVADPYSTGRGLMIYGSSFQNIQASIVNNQFVNNGTAMAFGSGSAANFTVARNVVRDSTDLGIWFAWADGPVSLTLDGNVITSDFAGSRGIRIGAGFAGKETWSVNGTVSNSISVPAGAGGAYTLDAANPTGSFIINNTVVNAAFPFP